jgi:hypothetical protein
VNRNRLAALLIAVGGSVAGGFAYLSSTLSPSGQFLIECAPDDGDCVLVADPANGQCAVLLEGGGDRPGETSGLDGDAAQAARDLYSMLEANAISGFHALAKDGGCQVAMMLTREQAREWREVLTGDVSDGGSIGQAIAVLTPGSPLGIPIQWAGGSTPAERTEGYDLSAVDGGTP